jgi:hypothetical protein
MGRCEAQDNRKNASVDGSEEGSVAGSEQPTGQDRLNGIVVPVHHSSPAGSVDYPEWYRIPGVQFRHRPCTGQTGTSRQTHSHSPAQPRAPFLPPSHALHKPLDSSRIQPNACPVRRTTPTAGIPECRTTPQVYPAPWPLPDIRWRAAACCVVWHKYCRDSRRIAPGFSLDGRDARFHGTFFTGARRRGVTDAMEEPFVFSGNQRRWKYVAPLLFTGVAASALGLGVFGLLLFRTPALPPVPSVRSSIQATRVNRLHPARRHLEREVPLRKRHLSARHFFIVPVPNAPGRTRTWRSGV